MMKSIFKDTKDWARTKTIQIEEEIAKIVLMVAPLIFVFFTSQPNKSSLAIGVIIFLVIAMTLAMAQLLITRWLHLEFFNSMHKAMEFEAELQDIKRKNPDITYEQAANQIGDLDISKIANVRKYLNYSLIATVLAFLIAMILLIMYIINDSQKHITENRSTTIRQSGLLTQ